MLQSMRSAGLRYFVWAFVAVAFVVVFLLLDTSGLIGNAPITTQTPVATVNGRDVLYQDWTALSQQLSQQEQARIGRSLTLDEQRQVEARALDQLVSDLLLEEEYRRRGITVTDDEIRQYAEFAPPPWLAQSPELYTEGRFDRDKYRRLLGSPMAQQRGLLYEIERWYRAELPKQKLYEQVASGVYLTDARLWRMWQDERDSAAVAYVALRPDDISDTAVTVSDAEIRDYYRAHRDEFERPGRAVVSLLTISRPITAADTAASRARAASLRAEILGGASFEDVARRESMDTVSGAQGGDLGRGPRGRFVPSFEEAAYRLRPGEISQPVETQFGFHLIRVDERKGDTLALRHILVPIQQSDSAAGAAAQRADALVGIVGPGDPPARFDSAARTLGLPIRRAVVTEGEPLILNGQYIPSVSAWAFDGVRPGETSELFDSEDGYFVARLDSLTPGGIPRLEDVRSEVRQILLRRKKVEALVPRAREIAQAAVGTSLEQAAQRYGQPVERTGTFNRTSFVPGIGRLNEAIGAAFALPVGSVSQPIVTEDAVYVIRVERRVNADRAAWEAQKEMQRAQLTQRLRQQRVQEFVENLRRAAEIEDRRRELNAAARQAQT